MNNNASFYNWNTLKKYHLSFNYEIMIKVKSFKALVLFTILFISNVVLLQESTAQQRTFDLFNEYLLNKNRESLLDNIEGSPYAEPSFSDGVVFLKGNKRALKFPLRYNNYFDEMEYKADNLESFLVLDNKNDVDSILLNNEKYIYLTKDDENNSDGYFIVLTKGKKCNLLLKKSIKFRKEVPAGGYRDYVPAKFIPSPDKFFVQFHDGDVVEIPRSRKKAFSIFNKKGFQELSRSNFKYEREKLISFIESICN